MTNANAKVTTSHALTQRAKQKKLTQFLLNSILAKLRNAQNFMTKKQALVFTTFACFSSGRVLEDTIFFFKKEQKKQSIATAPVPCD
ncbi:hypothetical protein DS834_06335 [Lactobacillus bombicola]|uniref:Uncharacterized protein n=1 Tax=Lactobacillus bombicola TaxID=1505723 RepID=A0ABX9LVJ6_9LACO|nr:hypothetical protein DS834_06335 [Lactobacillus bombicola]